MTELTPATVLPVQPGLTWDPAAANPWLLYNTPLGMAYYDPIGGVNLWPPSNFLDASGSPLPIGLPLDYAFLPPTPASWINTNVPLGNAYAWLYLMSIPGFIPPIAPVIGPLGFTGVPGITGIPGVPTAPPGFFLPPSALLPGVAPLPVPTAVAPLPVPTAVAPLPVPTAVAPLPVTTAIAPLPVPTVIAPTALAPLPVPTVVAPTALAPTALAPLPVPTVVAPTVVAPTAVILQLTAPTAVVLPATTVVPAAISGLLFPFI
ncbi:MAG: hypothetical protein AB1611_14240 [bacterium]